MRNELGEEGMREVMEFRVTGSAPDPSQIPARLSTSYKRLDPDTAVRQRNFSFQRNRNSETAGGLAGREPPVRPRAHP
jgi:hypothetical protein